MATQYWDDVLYPPFRAQIRGTIYGVITIDQMDEECFNLARRAISAFKFPKKSTDYTVFWGVRDTTDSNTIIQVSEDEEGAIPHAYFNTELDYEELEILIAWMKVYWCELQISNADNFEEIYTDTNIKTYSRANAVDKNLKLLDTFREYARELENRYSRVSSLHTPTMGDINEDDE